MNENFNVEERNYFSNGGKINIDMLNRISNGTADSICNINKLLYTSGVLFLPTTISQNFVLREFSNNGADIKISVGYIDNADDAAFGGVAIDNDGRFITISQNEYYVGCTEDKINYDIDILNWNGTVRATDPNLALTDGSGPTGKYSRNSGNYNIPLQINPSATDSDNINYVYIKYVQVVEQTSNSSQVTSDGVNTYQNESMYKGGYVIRVINPNYTGDDSNADIQDISNFDVVLRELGYIKIGEVYLTSVGVNQWDTSFSTTGTMVPTPATTQYAYFNGSMVGAPFLGYAGGITYPSTAGNYIDLYTHVNAIGTGSVNTNNPHGLSAQDLGINVNNSGINQVSSQIAEGSTTYTLDNPILDLTDDPNYDTILVDATVATGQDVTVRLPQANIENLSLRYTIKRIDTNTGVTSVSVSSIVDGCNSYIENNTTLVDDTYSVHELGILGSTNNCVTLCVGINASNNYNWYII